MAILDFFKAFDAVPHKRLLGKLITYGMAPSFAGLKPFLLTVFKGLLWNGLGLRKIKVLSGVPHGTVLGPRLFLLYINDLPSVVTSQVRLFADDCLLYRPILCGADRVTLQRDLDFLEKRCDTWGMRFTHSLTHCCA